MAGKLDFKGLKDVAITFKKAGVRQELTTQLLEELSEIEDRIGVDTKRSKEIKLELEEIQMAAKLKGLRTGELCYIARLMEGKKTLDKMMLMENGVKAKVIEESMKVGEPYVERRFKNLAKRSGKGTSVEDSGDED